MMTYNEYKQT